MRRLPDWRSRLHAALDRDRRAAFVWGVSDCALRAANLILAMTGFDPAATFRGRYGNREDGIALLRDAGHEDHVAFVAAHFPEVAPATARAGDLVVIIDGEARILGVVNGATVLAPGHDGTGAYTRNRISRAFKVG